MKLIYERDRMVVYPNYLMDIVATKDIAELGVEPVARIFGIVKYGFISVSYDESCTRVGEELFERLLADPGYSTQVVTQVQKRGDELLEFCDIVKEKDVTVLSDAELIDLYEQYASLVCAMRVWGWVPVFVDGFEQAHLTEYLTVKLKSHLELLGRVDEFSEVYAVLSSSGQPSEVQQEEIGRLEILKQLADLSDAEKILDLIKQGDIEAFKFYEKANNLLEKHRKQYEWLTYAYIGPVMSFEHLVSLCKDDLERGDIDERFEALKHRAKDLHEKKQEAARSLKLTDELQRLFGVSAEFMHLKDQRKGVYQKSYVVMDIVLDEIARRLDMDVYELKHLVFEEVRDSLINGKRDVYAEEAKSRVSKCCYMVEGGKISVYSGEECERLIGEYIAKSEDVTDTELKGMTAYPGKVVGKVKVVLVAHDVGKMEEGDVLVSASTNPDLILAMKRAAAIVTDMGGITSHAAIVSREMRKPCVVGAKVATKVLKDGDMVEVDANHSVIKVIKQAE